MEISEKLKDFILENIDLINENSKESWEEIYKRTEPYAITGQFTKMILDSGINDPARIMGYIPRYYIKETDIKNYIIPSNVTSIGDHAFRDCDSLTSVEIPDSVTSIGENAFYNCSSLTSVKIPDKVTSITDFAFAHCDSLTSIVIPNNVTSIHVSAFDNCSSLTNIKIPNSVKSIGYTAFYKCHKLMSVEIPASVTRIGGYAFASCPNLKEINFKGTKEQAINCGIGNKSEKKWRIDSAIEKIICSDGEIKLN